MGNSILIFENDEKTIGQIKGILDPMGYSVTSSMEAESGMGTAKAAPPSLIFMNLATPGTNGLEICKTIHTTEGLKEVPIILLTLREGTFQPFYTKQYGIVAFLKKPFEEETLVELVKAQCPIEHEEEPSFDGTIVGETQMAGDFDTSVFDETPASEEEEVAAVEGYSLSDSEESLSDLQASFNQPVEYPEGEEPGATTTSDEEAEGAAMAMEGLQPGAQSEDWTGGDQTMTADASSWGMGGGGEVESTTHEDTGVSSWDTGGGGEVESTAHEDTGVSSWDTGGGEVESTAHEESGESSWGAGAADETMTMGGGEEPAAHEESGESSWSAGAADETMTMGGGEEPAAAEESSWSESGDADKTMAGGIDTSWGAGGEAASAEPSPSDEGWSAGGDESSWSAGGETEEPSHTFGALDQNDFAADGMQEPSAPAPAETEKTMQVSAPPKSLEPKAAAAAPAKASPGKPARGKESSKGERMGTDDQDLDSLFDDGGGIPELEEAPQAPKTAPKKGAPAPGKKGFKKGGGVNKKLILVLVLVLVLAGAGAAAYLFLFNEPAPPPPPPPPAPRPAPKAQQPAPAVNAPAAAANAVAPAAQPKPGLPSPADEFAETPKSAPSQQAAPAQPAPAPTAQKPAPAKPAPAPAPARAAGGGVVKGAYYVQFGAFKDKGNADKLAASLSDMGLTITTTDITVKGNEVRVVLLDEQFGDRGTAMKRAAEIKAETKKDTAVFKP